MAWRIRAALNKVRLLGSLLLSAAAVPAGAATMTVTTTAVPELGSSAQTFINTIRITGVIERGDAERLRQALVELRRKSARRGDVPLATAELSSIGGDVEEGIKIGYLFREFEVPTVVRKSDLCLSACALAFLGGTQAQVRAASAPSRSLEIGAEVGFHNFALNPGTLKSMSQAGDPANRLKESFELGRGGTSMIVRYASDMGVDTDFVVDVLTQSAERMDYVDSAANFVALQVCPSAAMRPAGPPDQQAANICVHALGWGRPANVLKVTPLSARQARLRLLGHVRRNVRTLDASDRLSAQIDAVMQSKEERLITSTYASLRAAGVPLPELSAMTYEVGGYATGTHQMSCMVSFSANDPDRYDVVVQGPEGLARARHKAPPSCHWLFRHDPQAVLNPPR